MQQTEPTALGRHLIAHGDAINPLEYGKLGLDHSISAALEHGEITEKSRVHKCILSDRDPYRYSVLYWYRVDCTVPELIRHRRRGILLKRYFIKTQDCSSLHHKLY